MAESNFAFSIGSFLNRLGGSNASQPPVTTESVAPSTHKNVSPNPNAKTTTKSKTAPPTYGTSTNTSLRLSPSATVKSKSSTKPTAPSPKPKSDTTYSDLSSQYVSAKEAYGKSFLKKDTVDYSKSPKIKIHGGKDPNIDVPKQVLQDVVTSAKRNGIDPYEALAQVSLESSFGTNTGAGYNKSDLAQASLTDILQGWNLDEPYRPQPVEQFLEQKGVPGVKAVKDKHEGYVYKVTDEKKMNQYLSSHPEVVKAYQKHLQERSTVPETYNAYDAAFKRDKKGISYYNPDPAYAKNLKKYAAQFREQKEIKEIVEGAKG